MRKTGLVAAIFLLIGGCANDGDDLGSGSGDGADDGADGADEGDGDGADDAGDGGDGGGEGGGDGGGVDLPAPDGFRRLSVANAAARPVAAFADGTLKWAHVDAGGAARLSGESGGDLDLAEPGGAATSIAMVADADGALHLVWDPGGAIAYARVVDGEVDEVEVLAAAGREATIALRPGGGIAVAYTVDVDPGAIPPSEIMVHRADLIDGVVAFDTGTDFIAGCCQEAFGTLTVSGPSLAVAPDDSLHVVFEWGGDIGATIDYVTDRSGQLQSTRIVGEAAFVPCPAIMADDDGAYITYLLTDTTTLWAADVDTQGLVSNYALMETGPFSLALLVGSPGGDRGVVASRVTATGTEIVHAGIADGVADVETLLAEGEGNIALSPVAGGVFSDGQRFGTTYVLDADHVGRGRAQLIYRE